MGASGAIGPGISCLHNTKAPIKKNTVNKTIVILLIFDLV
jgi:hypothetical protein